MLAIRLPEDIEKRLASLARKTGRTKSFYVREAILEHIEMLEDAFLAEKRLREFEKSGEEAVSLRSLMKDHGLES